MPAETMDNAMIVQFWGVRGSLPVPGKETIRYGGNTNCVTVTFDDQHLFIFDAGTGIKELSNFLVKQKKSAISAKIFITHPHYDHISGIPFFVPLYKAGNEFEFFGTNIRTLISNQMDKIYFPITINAFSAKLTFHNIVANNFQIEDIQVQTITLAHPGICIGYRIQRANKSFCYITDNELYLTDSPQYDPLQVDQLIQFIAGADILVIDSTYTDEEYLQKIGWGHSCISRVVDVADQAKVKLLCLYHHDPDQRDTDIDFKLAEAKRLLESRGSLTRCIAPQEGEIIPI